MGPILIYALFLAACGAAASRSSRDQGDESVPDASTPDAPIAMHDMGPDAEVLPMRDGINERWTTFDDCVLSDLVLADEKLYALCKGTTNRLLSCPIDQGLKTTACEEFVRFDKPLLDEEFLEISPLVHTVLNDQYSVVTFTSVPDNHPGFYVVDRSNQTVSDSVAFETPGIRVGNDVLPLRATLPWGAFLMGDLLLLATRDRNFDEEEESYILGTFSPFTWNGDGTVTPIEGELGLETILNNGFQPTLFLPGEEPDTARLLNNGFLRDGIPTGANFDFIYKDADGNTQVDPEQNIVFNDIAFEPLKHFSFNPDQSSLLLAGQPYGTEEAKLYVAGLELSEGLNVGTDPIVSVVWSSQGADNEAFVTSGGSQVFGVTITDDHPTALLPNVRVYGTPTVSVLHPSEASCMFYQGLQLSDSESAITAMQCGALQGLN